MMKSRIRGFHAKFLALGVCLSGVSLASSGCMGELERIAKRWDIQEFQRNGDSTLIVPLLDQRQVWITRSDASQPPDKVEIFWAPTGSRSRTVVEYVIRGEFGAPQVGYSGEANWLEGEGRYWIDLDCDSTFDGVIQWGGKGFFVLVDDDWVRAKAVGDGLRDGVVSEAGVEYRFDVTSGKWVKRKGD